MSVPVPYRSESELDYLEGVYALSVKIGTTYARMPVKYHSPYGQKMAESALEALKFLQIAKGIYISQSTTEMEYQSKIYLMEEAKGIMRHINTLYQIYVKIRTSVEQPTNSVRNKWIEQGKNIIDASNKCSDNIEKAIKRAKRKYQKYCNKTSEHA